MAPSARITRSAHWLLIEGPDACGLARIPRGADQAGRSLEDLAAQGLRRLAGLVNSIDLFEAALGLAALNAHYNRPGLEVGGGNGLDAFAEEEGRVVAIGSFPDIARRLPNALVVDAQPDAHEYPAAAADWLLPGCAAAVITASTIANRSLPRLLDLARGARVALAGPGTPLTPRLFSYGVEILAGFIVDDPDGMAQCIAGGATPRGFRQFGRQVTAAPARMNDTRRAALPPWFRPPPPAEHPGHALIVGAGIAGAAMAAALIRRGWRVTVAERHDRVAAGASGNPAGIHMPRVVAGNSPERDFHAGAYRYGLDELDRLGTGGQPPSLRRASAHHQRTAGPAA